MCPRCAVVLLERTTQHLTKLYPICRYGLLASVLADHRDDFDLFLSFYNHYENTQGLMCWQQVQIEQDFLCALQLQPLHVGRPVACYSELVTSKQTHSSGQHTHKPQVLRQGKVFTNPDLDANATSSAPDGDLDAAYALLLAGRKWQHSAYTDRGVKVTKS